MPDEITREPPYQQIARHYRERIERGELQPGDPLPSVREMAEHWQVAQTTTIRALRVLQAEGYASSRSGVGTIVASGEASAPTAEFLTRYLRETGTIYPPGYQHTILATEVVLADQQLADTLGIETGTEVIRRHRIVRDASGAAVELSTNYVPRALVSDASPLLDTKPLLPLGVLGYVEAQTGRPATSGTDQYCARAATAEEADALQLRPGDPVLVERHWTMDADGDVLDYAMSVEPGERWRTRRYQIAPPAR